MNRKTSTIISIGLSLALIAVGIWFLENRVSSPWYGGRGWSMGYGGMMGGSSGVVVMVFWLIILVAVIALIWGVLGGNSQLPTDSREPADALEILKRRYARGEIDKTEYENKRRDLER